METKTSAELLWQPSVTPAMVAQELRGRRGENKQSVVFNAGESSSNVIGQITLTYVSSAPRKPFADYLQTNIAYHWKAVKAVYCSHQVPAQSVEQESLLLAPFCDVPGITELCTVSSVGKK